MAKLAKLLLFINLIDTFLARLRRIAQMMNSPMVSIVDDDESIRESITSLVRSVGYRAEAFASARGIPNFQRFWRADCLILDVCLPGTSGLDLQRQLFPLVPHPDRFYHRSKQL